MPEWWMVTIQGKKFRGWLTKQEAERVAEEYQGSSTTIGGRTATGLLKHKDFVDHVEAKLDVDANRECNEMYDRMKRNQDQRIIY